MTTENHSSDWKMVWSKLESRLENAFKKPTFIFSFLIFIVWLGSAGVWLPYVFDPNVTIFFRADALLTYCIAIISSMLIDFLLENNFRVETKSLALISIGIVVVSIFLLIYFYVNSSGIIYGIIGTVLTLLLWFVFNANNPKYDEVAKSSAIGGDKPTKGGLING